MKTEGGCVRKLHSYKKLQQLHILHTEIYHVVFPLEEVRTFIGMFTAFVD